MSPSGPQGSPPLSPFSFSSPFLPSQEAGLQLAKIRSCAVRTSAHTLYLCERSLQPVFSVRILEPHRRCLHLGLISEARDAMAEMAGYVGDSEIAICIAKQMAATRAAPSNRLDLRIRRGAQNQVGYVRNDALKGVPG